VLLLSSSLWFTVYGRRITRVDLHSFPQKGNLTICIGILSSQGSSLCTHLKPCFFMRFMVWCIYVSQIL